MLSDQLAAGDCLTPNVMCNVMCFGPWLLTRKLPRLAGAVFTLLGTKPVWSPWLQDVEAPTAILVAPSAIPRLPVGSTMQHPQLHASLHRKTEDEGPLEVAQTPDAALCMFLSCQEQETCRAADGLVTWSYRRGRPGSCHLGQMGHRDAVSRGAWSLMQHKGVERQGTVLQTTKDAL